MAKMRKLSLNATYNSTGTERLQDFSDSRNICFVTRVKATADAIQNSHLEPFDCIASPVSVFCRLICTVTSQVYLRWYVLLFMHRCLITATFVWAQLDYSVRACGKIMTLPLQRLKPCFRQRRAANQTFRLSRLLQRVLACSIFVNKLFSSVLLT